MFDIGFSELVLLALIALIVLGPERLPRVARAMGYWTGRARAYARNFTAELQRQADLGDTVDEVRKQIHPEIDRLKTELKQAEAKLRETGEQARSASDEKSADG